MSDFNATSAGLPSLYDRFTICCSVYGDHLSIPAQALPNEDFVDAVMAGYDDCTLHDCGHLAMEADTGKLVFLVVAPLGPDTVLPEQVLQDLSKLCGVPVQLYTTSPAPEYPSVTVLTASFDRPEQFAAAGALVHATWAAEAVLASQGGA